MSKTNFKSREEGKLKSQLQGESKKKKKKKNPAYTIKKKSVNLRKLF